MEFSKLGKLSERVRVFGKCEWKNPGGSVKDRPAATIVLAGLENGRLRSGGELLDASSGNTGIAYAWLGAKLGFRVTLAVPASINGERRKVLEAYGASLILTDPLESSDGAIREAKARAAADPDRFFFADQYNNPENWKAHYASTGPELWEQSEGKLTHFVAGLGTTGTFRGTTTFLKEQDLRVRALSVQPDGPLHGLEGLKHLETAIVPGIHDPALADEEIRVQTEEAQSLCRRTAKELGVLLGPSGGAALLAALRLGERLSEAGAPATIATVLPDSGERYLAERFWREA